VGPAAAPSRASGRGTVVAVAIPDDDVARVRAATDMVALVGEHVGLKRQGRRWVGLCPFHQERSPSFSVNAEEGLYYCFGCQRSGDAITFVRETEHLDFADAVRRLAERAGLTITEDATTSTEQRRRASLVEALGRAVVWYHERLLRAEDAGPARQYLRSRGYGAPVVRQFQLGWAPEGWDELARYLEVPDEVLAGSGLGFRNRAGRQQDAFRGRVLFPIFDPAGKPIGFGGRALPRSDGTVNGPKYKNSPDGPLYAKRRVLYGLNWAKHDVVATGEVIVCEGYTDVIGCFQAGLPRAVATCGTALGEEHFRLLANFAGRIVLAYDADAAGQAGAGRVHEWEQGHGVDVVVAELPAGSDPADLARADPERLRTAVAEARPMLQFQVDRALAALDRRHPEGRARAAEAALALVAEHPSALVRDQYLMQVADRCQLEAPALRAVLDALVAERAGAATGRRPGPSAGGRGAGSDRRIAPPPVAGVASSAGTGRPDAGATGPERLVAAGTTRGGGVGGQAAGLEALRLAVHDPVQVARLLEPCLFLDPHQRAAFEALAAEDDLHRAVARAEQCDGVAAELLRRVAVEEPTADGLSVAAQLVRVAVRQALRQVDRQARLAPHRFVELAGETAVVRGDLEAVDVEPPDEQAVVRLVAWLGRRGEEDG